MLDMVAHTCNVNSEAYTGGWWDLLGKFNWSKPTVNLKWALGSVRCPLNLSVRCKVIEQDTQCQR